MEGHDLASLLSGGETCLDAVSESGWKDAETLVAQTSEEWGPLDRGPRSL